METIKWQTRVAYGCLVAGQSLWVQALPTAYRMYANSICDIKKPLQLQYVVLYMLYAFSFDHHHPIIFFNTAIPLYLCYNYFNFNAVTDVKT